MLKKNERIKYSGLFKQAFQKGKTLRSKNLRLTFTRTLEKFSGQLPLVGIIVSKNFSKKAVARNRIKRQLREVYRLFRLEPQNAEKLKKIGLLVFSVNPNSEKLNFKDIEKEITKLLYAAMG